MTYPEIVQAARKAAEENEVPMVVFHNFEDSHHIEKGYNYTTKKIFDHICVVVPVIRMLLIMPNGKIVQ